MVNFSLVRKSAIPVPIMELFDTSRADFLIILIQFFFILQKSTIIRVICRPISCPRRNDRLNFFLEFFEKFSFARNFLYWRNLFLGLYAEIFSHRGPPSETHYQINVPHIR